MFDNFFSHYDLLIAPTHRCNSGMLTSKSVQRMPRTTTSPIKNAEEICGDTYKNLYYNEKKKNMVLRHENSKLKEKLKELTAQALSLSEEIYKEKINNDRSADHIIKLEKVIQKIKYSNPKSLRTQPSKPSILKHHSSSHNITNISTRIRSNNNNQNNTSTYRTSKRNTTDIDLNTNNNINNNNINLTTSTTSNPSNILNSDLLKELEKLKQFKENVFTLSLTCDDINSNVFKCFDNVTKLLVELNSKFYSNVNDDKVFTLYDFEFNQYKLIHCSLQDIVNTMKRFLQFKQDEYVILLEEKNNEIKELQSKLKNKEEFIIKQKNEIFDVNVQSEQLKNEIVLLNQLKKNYLDVQFGEQKQNIKQLGRNGNSNSEYNNTNHGNNNNSFSDEIQIMKHSVCKSLKRIERTFQEDNPVKKELIDKMKNI